MAAVLIGGSGRGAGKTAVGCALIAAMPEFQWLAVKVTPHRHGLQQGLSEETELESAKDTGRYLRAGAMRSFLVLEHQTGNGELLKEISQRAPEANAWMVESGSVEPEILAEIAGPVVSLAVLSGDAAEWKASLASRPASIDALVLTGGLLTEELPPGLRGKKSFYLPKGKWVTAELLVFVRERLLLHLHVSKSRG